MVQINSGTELLHIFLYIAHHNFAFSHSDDQSVQDMAICFTVIKMLSHYINI